MLSGTDDQGSDITYELGVSVDIAQSLVGVLEDFAYDVPGNVIFPADADKLKAILLPWAIDLLRDSALCVVARSGSKVVGAAFNSHVEPGSAVDGGRWLGSFFPTAEILAHEQFWLDLASGVDFCSQHGGVPTFKVGTLTCCREYRGQGIASSLVKHSLALAASKGYRAAAAYASSAYSKSIFEKLGFKNVAEASYHDHPNAAFFSPAHKELHQSFVAYSMPLHPYVHDRTANDV